MKDNSLKTRLVRTFIINHSKGDFDLSTKLVMKLFIHSPDVSELYSVVSGTGVV